MKYYTSAAIARILGIDEKEVKALTKAGVIRKLNRHFLEKSYRHKLLVNMTPLTIVKFTLVWTFFKRFQEYTERKVPGLWSWNKNGGDASAPKSSRSIAFPRKC